MNLTEIGIIKSDFTEPADPFLMREHESRIIIKKEFDDGLYRLNESEFIEVIFFFDRVKEYDLKHTNYYGEYKGLFATRTPRRPSPIGLSKVKLLKIEGNILTVKGLDALDSTPVLDIKPYNSGITGEDWNVSELKDNPRKNIMPLIKNKKLEELLVLCGALHGHFCPGLATGVIGAVYAVDKIKEFTDGMEDICAVAEINSCYTDAIQMITGCTIGNNSFIYRDLGKTAFSLVKRSGGGIRLSVKPGYREIQRKIYPDFQKYFELVVINKNRDKENLAAFKKYAKEASFKMLNTDINDIFKIEDVRINLPDYAPIRDSIFCSICGESIMKNKEKVQDGKTFCRCCAGMEYYQLDGAGIILMK